MSDLKALVKQAVKGEDAFNTAMVEIKKQLKGKDRDTVKATLLPLVASAKGVAVTEKGKLDSSDAQYETVRKFINRMVAKVVGVSKKPPTKNLRLSTEVREEFDYLWSLFDGDAEKMKQALRTYLS